MLCYGLGESDQPRFEYLARTTWHKAGRPEKLDDFFATATLTLSPLPHLTDSERNEYQRMVEGWIGELEPHASGDDASGAQTKSATKRSSHRGVAAILSTPFEHRPRQPALRRRPYAFGTPEQKRAYFERCCDVDAVHRHASNEFRTSNRNVPFPVGTYPPPIMYAA